MREIDEFRNFLEKKGIEWREWRKTGSGQNITCLSILTVHFQFDSLSGRLLGVKSTSGTSLTRRDKVIPPPKAEMPLVEGKKGGAIAPPRKVKN